MNNNEKNEKRENPIKTICNEALLENSELKQYGRYNGRYIGKTREAELIKNLDFQPAFRKHLVHLHDEPVSLQSFTNFDPNVCATAGWYNIIYVPKNSKRYVKGKPYIIGQDLVRLRVTVSGFAHWQCLGKRIPELAWIDRWCPLLTPELFGLAKRHPGMNFYFSPDWVAYAKLVTKKAEEQGIDIDNTPFVTYMTTVEKLAKLNETYLLAPKKTKSDYADQLEQIDDLSEVKEEMRYE